MKQIIILFGFIVLVSLTQSCGQVGVNFNPDAAMATYEDIGIVHEDGRFISCMAPEFNDYACMNVEKWKELKELLTRIRLDRKTRAIVSEKVKQIDKAFKHE